MAALSQRLFNSWQVWRAVRAGRAFERASREEMDAYVSRRLSDLVQFAAERVPYYRELFAREGIDPREIRAPADLRRLPMLTKAVLGPAPERLMPEGATADRCFPLTTSGTTGRVTLVWYDLPAVWESVGRAQPQRDAQTRLRAPALAGGPKLTIARPGVTQLKQAALYREELLLRPRQAAAVEVSLGDPPAEIIARIREVRPRLIATIGSVLEILALHLQKHGRGVELPFLFTYSSDALSDWAREYLEEQHGAKVLSTYTAGETTLIAYDCGHLAGETNHHGLLHQAEDVTLLRVCDERGGEVEEGSGEVLVTNLQNRQTVLINYRLGDRVETTTERCPCGTNLRCLRRVEGRNVSLVVRPDGRLVTPMVLAGILARAPRLVRGQFIQEEPGRSRVRLLLGPQANRAELEASLTREFRVYVGPEMKLDYEVVRELAADPGVRFESVVSKIRPSGGAS
jgi:phenylacetate-CoA ligase